MTVRCVVAAINGDGDPDLYFVKVNCTEDQYLLGIHYDAAEFAADREGYEACLAYDEHDSAGKAMMALFDWNTASEINANEID